MVHIGLVGCGKMGQRHLKVYNSFPSCNVVVFDVNSHLAQSLTKQFNVGKVTDLESLLSNEKIDAIDICVPTALHKEIAIRALDAGKHVFCEKPLCVSLIQAEEIEAARLRSGRNVMVGYIYRFTPAFQFVKHVLDTNVVGKPYFAIMRIGGRGSQAEWKHKQTDYGGAKWEMLVHKLDLAQWFFGKMSYFQPLWKSVLLRERIFHDRSVEADAEDYFVARARAANTEILYEADMVTPGYIDYVDIQGDNGSIFASVVPHIPTTVYCKSERNSYAQGINVFTFPETNFLEAELRYFLDLIRGEAKGAFHSVNDTIILLKALSHPYVQQ